MKLIAGILAMLVVIFLFFGERTFAVEDLDITYFSLPEVFEYPPVKGRDPFYPLIQQKKEKRQQPPPLSSKPKVKEKEKPLQVVSHSKYKLIGIVWYERKGVALISGEGKTWVVEEGMSINGLKVARIDGEKGEVMLVGEDKIIQLKMEGIR